MSFQRLSIIGFGMMGASVARAVQQYISDCEITAYDLRPENVSEFLTPRLRLAATLAEATRSADCIILAVPPEHALTVLRQMSSDVPERAIVTDITSVKRRIVIAAESTLRHPSRFVGGHPMAGSDRSGSSNARANLFERAAVILTPTSSTDPSAVSAVQAFWQKLGARVHQMSPADHDAAMAAVSHSPHVLAAALMHIIPRQAEAIIGPGFRDLTRIAAGDPELWRQILISNADQVQAVLQSVKQQLQQLDWLLEPEQQAELGQWLAEAAAGRRRLDTISNDS